MTSTPPDPGFDPKHFADTLGLFGHAAHLGLRYAGQGADWVELAIAHDPRLVGNTETGVLASGPIIALMDMATSLAVWLRIGRFVPQVTLDMRIDYLRPAAPGRDVIGRGECYRITRQIAFVRGQAHDGDPDDPVAHVTGTFMFTPDPPPARSGGEDGR